MKPFVFLNRLLLYYCPVFIFVASVLSTGCTTVHKDFKPFSALPEQQGKVAAKVAVVMTDELRSFYYKPRDFQEFSLGPVLCENVKNAANAAFSQPSFFKNTREAVAAQAVFIGVVRPRIARLSVIREIPATVITSAALSWELLSGDGKRLYGATIYGDGRDQRSLGMSDVRYESSMQQCMDDLTAHLYQEMLRSPQRASNNTDASRKICSTVEGYQPGITTYAQYRQGKSNEWHIFAVHERARYGDLGYSYLLDPASDKHISLIGDWPMVILAEKGEYDYFSRRAALEVLNKYRSVLLWGSHWGMRLGAIESLRPSVYLPQSKIDQAKVNSVYIRELIGSVYDDRPLCELVFEGNSMDTCMLKSRSCSAGVLPATSYFSVDAYKNNQLNDTARQWVKLRPGMSKEEVGSLLGPPRLMTLSMSGDGWIFDYGCGLVNIYKKGGLSHWQLD